MSVLSVIIPVYNAKDTIEKCISSVLNQTLDDIEIIVINDNSSDNTAKVLSKFNDNRLKIVNNEKNSGQGYTRNIGIEQSGGEFIGFVDNDDYIDNDYFEKMVDKLREENAQICVSLKIRNIVNGKIHPHLITPDNPKEIVFVERCAPWAKVIRRDFLIKNNIRFDLTRGEDIYPAFLEAYFADKITFIKNSAYNYNVRSNSISHKKTTKEDIKEFEVYEKIFDFIKDDKDKKQYLKLTEKKGMISFDFLYKRADKNIKGQVVEEYKRVFKKDPIKIYPYFKFIYRLKKLISFIRGIIYDKRG